MPTKTSLSCTMASPDLDAFVVPIDSVQPHPDNARRGNIDGIRQSLRTHGQYRPIVVQKSTGYICIGNNTWHAAIAEGWTGMAVEWLDVDDDKARAIRLVDNRLNDDATYDEEAMQRELTALLGSGEFLGSGWDPDEVDDFMARMEAIQESPYQEFKGDYADYGDKRPTGYVLEGEELPETDDAEPQFESQVGRLREVVVMVQEADYGDFLRGIQKLQLAYGTSGVAPTVIEAIRRESSDH